MAPIATTITIIRAQKPNQFGLRLDPDATSLAGAAVAPSTRSVICARMKVEHPAVWTVPQSQKQQTLAAFVKSQMDEPWSRVKRFVATGKVFVDDQPVTDVAYRLTAGQSVTVMLHAPRPADGRKTVRIVHEDTHVVVIDKPSGVSSVPYEAHETGTAMDLLRAAWRRKGIKGPRIPLHVVHRIDKATSGLLMFAKSKRAERGLATQLREHTVERTYLCIAHGQMRAGRIESRLVRDRGDGLRGSTRDADRGKTAITHVEVVRSFAQATLCQVQLETGKTHQIRIHFSEAGNPLVGETVYIRDYLAGSRPALPSDRLLLHAATLGFTHPVTGNMVRTSSELPTDFEQVLSTLVC